MARGSGRPRDTDPLSLTEAPTGSQIVTLWRTTNDRFPTSRKRIQRARDVMNREPNTLPLSAEVSDLTLPQRLLAVTMTNSLSSQYGVPELTRYGKPTASDKSDQIETVLKATLEDLISTPDLFGKATQDGEWGVAVLPAAAAWDACPVYDAERYNVDADDREADHPDYQGRDPGRSRRKFETEYEQFAAEQQYVTIDLIDPTDCAPILTMGRKGRRFEARGLAVRRLFEREELLALGYRCPALSGEKATLVPRTEKGNARGRGGKLYLYTLYVTLWDEAKDELVPCIVYSVAGDDTYWYDRTGDGEKASILNLRDEWGITTPMWGYYHGLRTADPNPDKVGLPFADAYEGLVLSLERLMAAGVVHAERSSFKGSWVEPAENVPPEAYTETIDNQLRLKVFEEPLSGELLTAPGRVTPAAPAPLGAAASQMMAAILGQLQLTSPDPANPAGKGASGHAMSLASGLIEAAYSDIPRGVLECYQDLAAWTLECICAVMKTKSVPYVIDANEELPPDDPGQYGKYGVRRGVSQRYVLTERDIGSSYKITAQWRQRPDPVGITLAMDKALKGFGSVVDVLEASGETNTLWKLGEIRYYNAVMKEGTPEYLELSAYVAKKRGETERAEQLELEAKALLEPQGTPSAAIAPEAMMMAQQAAGQPSGVQTGVRSSIASTVQGAQEGGPIQQDARAGAAMGIRQAVPPSVGQAPVGGAG